MRRRAEQEHEHQAAQLRKGVVSLIHRGHVSKAVNRINSNGIANHSDRTVLAQLQLKFPPKKRNLPRSVSRVSPVYKFKDLRGSLLALPSAVAPGCGGLRNEFLVALGERMSDEEIRLLERFGLAYVKTELLPRLYKVWLSLQTVALYKSAEKSDVRPLGLRNSLVKLFHREVMLQCKVEVREFLEPVQLGQSVAGAAKLVHAIGGALRADQELICCRIDLKNAFNECSKTAILEALQAEESLSHLTTFAATILSPDVALESGGERWGMAEDGVAQGDVPSGAFFCVAQQASLVKLNQDCQQGDGLARAGYDDVYAVGKPEVVLPAVIRFQQDLSNRCGLTMQWGKTEWFSWDEVLPPHTPPELKFAGMFSEENNGEFMRGFMCYGIPLGTERYISHMLQQKAEEIAEDAIKTVQVLSGDRQALWSVLRLSTLTRFEYFCQLAPPSLCEPIACWLDGKLWSMLQAAVGFEVPRGEAGDKVACPVGELDRRSYQEWVVRLPIRLHGWGLRSLKETCGPAYFGALETAIPFMAARDKLCTQMETDWGGEECWGEAAEPSNRWRVVLESGCLEGRELQRWFQMLQSEATEAGPYLGEPPDPLLNSDLQGLGGSSVSGATRGLVVEARDMLRSRLLTKALQLHRPKKDRHAWAWKQRDKLSSAWLLSLPGGGETLTNEEFTTTAAVNLPALHGWT